MRHLKPSQLMWRVWYVLRRKLRLYRVPRIHGTVTLDRLRLRGLRLFLEQCHDSGMAEDTDMEALRRQSFRFLNHTVENTGHIPWADSQLPRLWRYQLHSFGYGRDFAINGVNDHYLGDRDRVLHWMRDWSARNAPGADVAWDAYTVSERLINWALMIAAFDIREDDIVAGYARQAAWLWRWLEYDIRANHLLKNAAALVVAASITGDEAARDAALLLLEAQLDEQLLDDGGHYERSPMYHAAVLRDVLVVFAALAAPPDRLARDAVRMTAFLKRICHRDGDIPLFGDAVLQDNPEPEALVAVACGVLPETLFEDNTLGTPGDGMDGALSASGYYSLGDPEIGGRLLIKTAAPAPAWQPGHSHADMLSYELCLGRQRIVVDSGVHGYAESPYRSYCRSGAAHNIACFEGIDQCETWGVFRIARRSEALPATLEQSSDGPLLTCGYQHYTGYHHTRQVRYIKESMCWEIQDVFEHASTGPLLCNYIHLHPDCVVARKQGGVVISRGAHTLLFEAMCGESMEVHPESDASPFRYCPAFGVARPAPVIVLRQNTSGSLCTGYKIAVVTSGDGNQSDLRQV